MNLSERYYEKLDEKINPEKIGLDGILLQLEVTNICNHKCYFCPNQNSNRNKKMMDKNFAKRVIAECAEYLGKNKKICFHMNGESLLYKDLAELVQYSKDLGYEYCFITTNGSVATEELLVKLFEAGLDSIKFSINGGSPATYKNIHGQDDFQKVINALRFSSDYRKKASRNYKIFVSCVGTKDNYFELEELKNLVQEFCDEVVFYYPCGYAGQNNDLARQLRYDLSDLNIKTFEIKHKYPCNVLWNSINVTCEGFLSLCCSESDNRLIIEDLNKMSVKEAWQGERMREIRQKHLNGDIRSMPCYSCITESNYDETKIDKRLFQLSLNERKKGKRVKNQIKNIDYDNTQDFFKNRAKKFKEDNPYSVVMYQDNNPKLVEERNRKEMEKLLPLLQLNHRSKILDVACGIGRWSDAIPQEIAEYCGIDFSADLIDIARKRNSNILNRNFLVGQADNLKKTLQEYRKETFNRILMIGILMYLNDEDLIKTLLQVESVSDKDSIICIREPIALEERLTLKNFYSEELKDNYNAIYRTRNEMKRFFDVTLLSKSFSIIEEGFLFEDEDLNNRKETAQYYYILKKE